MARRSESQLREPTARPPRDLPAWRAVRVFTIGHSTRTFDELVEHLRAFDVSTLADVRTVPRSRHNPQFNRDALQTALPSRGMRYVHLPELGGLRKARKDSRNTGWRNDSFRGYADYMLTPGFEEGLDKLRALTAEGTVAVMCAEAVPWRCHRSLIADALTARHARVEHITGLGRSSPHRLTAFAKVVGRRVTYPGEAESQLQLFPAKARPGTPSRPAAAMRLATKPPFHLEATVRVLQRRPVNLVDVWEEERYLRVLPAGDGLALVEVANRGTIDDPDVRFRVIAGSAPARGAIGRLLRRVLGLDLDPEPLRRVVEEERRLAATAAALRGLRPPRFPGLFEAFTNVVPFQQVSLDSGVAMVSRLVERFGDSIEHDGRRRYAFPEAHTIAAARLDAIKACGLSSKKAETLRGIAKAIESGDLSEEALSIMSSAEAIRALAELPGIGPWTAGLVLLRGLGRLDVFPAGDIGAARGLRSLLRLRAGQSPDRAIRRFGPYRGYLYFCSLGAALLGKGLIHPAPPLPEGTFP